MSTKETGKYTTCNVAAVGKGIALRCASDAKAVQLGTEIQRQVGRPMAVLKAAGFQEHRRTERRSYFARGGWQTAHRGYSRNVPASAYLLVPYVESLGSLEDLQKFCVALLGFEKN